MSLWLILRTSGGRTLPLAASLCAAGHDVWAPARTLRRYMPAKTPSGKRLIETDVPVLPTFVFVRAADDEPARAAQLRTLAIAAAQDPSPHPAFSIFRHAGRSPLIADREIAGLRREEEEQAATIQTMRDAESYAEAEAIRIAAIKSASLRRRTEQAAEREQRRIEHERARERRDALRAQQSTIAPGTAVQVMGTPALTGVTGVMEGVDGHYAHVRFGAHSWKIEGWQVVPASFH